MGKEFPLEGGWALRSFVIQEGPKLELHFERRQLRWFGHLIMMSPRHSNIYAERWNQFNSIKKKLVGQK